MQTKIRQRGVSRRPKNVQLITLRKNRGVSSRKAAESIGVSQAVLLGAENGSHPQLHHAKLIADFYGCKVTDLWPVAEAETSAAA